MSKILLETMNKERQAKKYRLESATTQCDSSQEHQCDYLSSISKIDYSKHKTQLCKTYSELGYCNYKDRCQFAHGRSQLVSKTQENTINKSKCKGFWGKGYCRYGTRCQFKHNQTKHEMALLLSFAKQWLKSTNQQEKRIQFSSIEQQN